MEEPILVGEKMWKFFWLLDCLESRVTELNLSRNN